jgi:hypothetical protein
VLSSRNWPPARSASSAPNSDPGCVGTRPSLVPSEADGDLGRDGGGERHAWRVDPRPDGSPVPDGPFIDAVEDKLELVASGQAVAIIPAIAGVSAVRPDLT